MSLFENTPLINTGNPTIDTQCGVVFSIAVLAPAYNVAQAFREARRERQQRRRSRRGVPDRTKAIGAFYVLALLSFATVTWLRSEHRAIKLVSMADIQEYRQTTLRGTLLGKEPAGWVGTEFVKDTANNIRLPNVDEIPAAASRMYDNVKHAAQSGASVASDFMHAGGKVAGAVADPDGRDGRQVKKQIDKTVKGVQRTANQRAKRAVDDTKAAFELSKTFPWAGGILKPNASVWDFFQSLIDTAPRYWWMQQWLAGYVVWAVYVGLECHYQDFRAHVALSFALLGYCSSLATMQCLFFALLLHKTDGGPGTASHRGYRRHQPLGQVVLVPAVLSLACVLRLPFETRAGWLDILQSLVMILPMCVAAVLQDRDRMDAWVKSYGSRGQAKFVLSIIWWTIGMACLVTHLVATYNGYLASDPASENGRWWLPTLDRFRRSSDKPAHMFHSIGSILSALGDHAWLNAVGWDVLFSTASIGLWAAVRSADPRSIAKCALWPWLDGTLEVVQDAAEYVQETTEPYVEATKQGVCDLQDAAQPYLKKSKQGISDFNEAAQPYLKKTKEYLDDEREYLGEVWDRNAPDAQEVMKKAKKGVDVGLERVGTASKRAVSSAAQLINGHGGTDDEADSLFTQRSSNAPDVARQARARRTYNEQSKGQDHDDQGDWDEVRSKKSPSPTKRRGRPPSVGPKRASSAPRKATSRSRTRNGEGQSSPTKRRSSRLRNLTDNIPGTSQDSDERSGWLPDGREITRTLRNSLPSSAALRITPDIVEGAEAGGLTLGLFVLGGLGLASAGVFGADGIQ
ncbi:hypothetical protein LTR01_002345 [Friedmanniomyces endolithicus]|nr:hypothetical protein LTR01_002345 [Friedmanniomyces endolithicus]KAK0827400.1 hypothetical protein LTR73_005637 [Friedmanniomyces endolithicus]